MTTLIGLTIAVLVVYILFRMRGWIMGDKSQ